MTIERDSDVLDKDTLTLRGTLTKKEFTKHGDYHFKKLLWTIFFLFLTLSFLIFVIGTWNEEDLANAFSYIFFALFSLIISSLLLLSLTFITKIKTSREYKSDPLIKREITYHISPQEIQQKLGRSNSYIEWNQIRVAYENKDMFRLYVSRAKAIVLPKRFFTSESDIQLLKKHITENISKEKVKI